MLGKFYAQKAKQYCNGDQRNLDSRAQFQQYFTSYSKHPFGLGSSKYFMVITRSWLPVCTTC